MKQKTDSKSDDVPQFSHNEISKENAEKLLVIIKNSNSLWIIAVNAYNLGRDYAWLKS